MKRFIIRLAIALSILLFVYAFFFSYCYSIQDNGVHYQVVSLRPLSQEEIVEAARIDIRKEDAVVPGVEKSSKVSNILIKRSKPVFLEIDGNEITYFTLAETVEELLNEKNIQLKEKDFINVGLLDKLENNEKIVIKTYSERGKVLTEVIPYKTIYETNKMAAKGLIFKKQQGDNGILEKHYKEIYFGGKKIREEHLYDKVAKYPTNEVFVIGAAKAPSKYVKSLLVKSTAYSPTVEETDSNPWVTASGLRSSFGVIAVDPKVIPMGTLVYVEGYGYAVAGDTGGAIKGNKIDVFFYSTSDSQKWGVRTVRIYILDGKWKFPEKLDY